MPWYLYLALRQLFSSGQRLFFTLISVASVGLGVALLIVVLSVMAGFRHEIFQKFVDTQGEVEVYGPSGGFIVNPESVQGVIRKVPGVVATTPFAQGFVMLEYENTPVFPTIQGIDVETVASVTPIGKYFVAGSLDNLDDDTVILPSMLARQIGAGLGSKVEIHTPLELERAKGGDEVLLPTVLTVAGLLEYGQQQLDSSTVVVTLRRMQQLYNLGHMVDGIHVKIAPGRDADAETDAVNEGLRHAEGRELPRLSGLEARSWEDVNRDFLWVIQLEKNVMTVIVLFVVVVAAFLTMSLLVVLVLKKTREIGLLGALGASRRAIALCFCLQGVCIGIVGTTAGIALGLTFLHFKDDLVGLVTRFTGSKAILERFYQFSEIPAYTDTHDLALIVVSAIVLSTLAGIIPALIAARLKPSEALRNE